MSKRFKEVLLFCIPIILIPLIILAIQKYQTKSQSQKQIYAPLPTPTISVQTPTQAPKITSPNIKAPGIYENKQYGFTVTYPTNWDVEEADENTGSELTGSISSKNAIQKVYFVEKEQNGWPGEFAIVVFSNPKKLSLNQWTKEYFVPLGTDPKTNLAKIKGDTQFGGKPAKKLSIFSFDHEVLAIATLNNGLIYYVTYTGDNPNDSNKETHDKIYNQILSSFKFIN